MIYLTGATGFVGKYFLNYFREKNIHLYHKGNECDIGAAEVVVHLAGKAHDLKNISTPAEYYGVNTELTKEVFEAFLASDSKMFITLSSVKAVTDRVECELTEQNAPNPITHYGKSKLLAEEYMLSKELPEGKRVYILRPCMIHGPGNKGNLNSLYRLVSKGVPWPLGAFENKRSFCSIDNLMFVFNEFMERTDIPSGIYNVADNEPIGTNMLITLIAESQNINPKIWKLPRNLVILMAKFGDLTRFPLDTERLDKLTQNYVVSNQKLLNAIGKELPINAIDGMRKTLDSFN